MNKAEIEKIVLDAMVNLNLSREPDEQIEVSPASKLFGREGPLDSMALVALLVDIEDAMAEKGFDIALMDEKAMSQKKSPFRDVPSLVDYLTTLVSQT